MASASIAPIDREDIIRMPPRTRVRVGLLLHAAYLLGTCAWTLFGARTFQLVTGPKHDVWLVKTVGVLCGAIGATLVAGAMRREPAPEVRALSAATTGAFSALDAYWVARGRISPVYMLNTLAQIAITAVWLPPWPGTLRRSARIPQRLKPQAPELARTA